ncbi:hypothetical protein [Actinoplanes sp. NPDC026619]|uniref:Lsr2 family DNA-binding protein n=1 Tax=Actinoplanes sp. NPDC026619 TaxID=3155798 RepID=UPI0033EC9F1A
MELGFAVLGIRTTGLSVQNDRITEIAVVGTDRNGRVEREWAAAGPHFGDIAGQLRGRTFAGHQAALGLRFVVAEFGGEYAEMPVLCTSEASRIHLPELARRRLRDCCAAAGVEYTESAGALGDARATARLLRAFLAAEAAADSATAGGASTGGAWAAGALAGGAAPDGGDAAARPRMAAGPAASGVLAALLDDLPLEDTLPAGAPEAAGNYLELVAHVLESGSLATAGPAAHGLAADGLAADGLAADGLAVEGLAAHGLAVHALAEHGRAVGLGRDDLDDLHRGLVPALARAAVAGGAVTDAVRHEFIAAAEALGVPSGGAQAILAEAGGELISAFSCGFRPLPHDWAYGEPLRAGQPVAFTGGEPYRRSRLELAARLAGLRVVNRVTGQTAVLVSGHARPRSAKGLAAQRAGTRIVTPKTFEKLAAHVQPTGPAGKAVTAATVRAWARANGHLVGPRGRLPRHVHDAFRAANIPE